MNLKFRKVDWDKNLMYIEFNANGQKFKWFPKWKEVDDILLCAWITEAGNRNKRWAYYFDIVCNELLLKGLLRRLAKDPDFTRFVEMDILISGLFRTLREVILKEEPVVGNLSQK